MLCVARSVSEQGEKMAGTLIQSNSDKLNTFLQDVQYHSLMVNSASFNVRLMRDRKTRLPFLDSQTGIAQSPCKLYMSSRHRMPGTHAGQLYAYPAQRWCRRKRSYLTVAQQTSPETDVAEHTIVTVENPAAAISTEDVAPPSDAKLPEMYYYDESSFLEEEEEEPDNEDDDTYTMRTSSSRKRKKGPKPKSSSKSPRGRKKREPSNYKIITDAEDDNPGKPYECSLCGARYKTRQGLSYHLSHTHRNGSTTNTANGTGTMAKSTPPPPSEGIANVSGSLPPSTTYQICPETQPVEKTANAITGLTEFQDSYLGFLASSQDNSIGSPTTNYRTNGGKMFVQDVHPISKSPQIREDSSDAKEDTLTLIGHSEVVEAPPTKEDLKAVSSSRLSGLSKDKRATPNSYCDFCLGSSKYNVKTGEPEEMVSCADCGRSGHLTCLQFTPNMIVSVQLYRWQCIECKCCTLCGTSENDDKLLFCDDCDRGYHLYCLTPPLSEPPEGEWSCQLCKEQFHKQN